MILKQYYLGCLAHASYLVGSETMGEAIIVDPQRDIGQYLEDAKSNYLEIKHVFLSHFHADFLAGHLELRERTGAKIYLGSRAEAEYEFVPMHDGDTLEFGDMRVGVLETPGHSPESISLVIYDLEADDSKPYAVLTGDTLFIGDVGRPDLRASLGWKPEELGGMLYDSLHNKLLRLPDETLVYPAHGAGSICGKNLSEDTVSTIGEQRLYNYALRPMSKENFIDVVLAHQPETPSYFTYDAILNTLERPTLESSLRGSMTPLNLEQVLSNLNSGGELIDVRDSAEFAGAHVRGSLNIGLGGKFATWAGTVLDPEKPIIIIAEIGREEEGTVRLGRIGFDKVVGFLKGGMAALEGREDLVTKTVRITAQTLVEYQSQSREHALVDVRAESEWLTDNIPGSVNVPLNHITERLGDLPSSRPIIVYCRSGYRSSLAASILKQQGIEDVLDLVGGIPAWDAVR